MFLVTATTTKKTFKILGLFSHISDAAEMISEKDKKWWKEIDTVYIKEGEKNQNFAEYKICMKVLFNKKNKTTTYHDI